MQNAIFLLPYLHSFRSEIFFFFNLIMSLSKTEKCQVSSYVCQDTNKVNVKALHNNIIITERHVSLKYKTEK